jgi:Protein of unknown function (DUF3088)
MAKDQLYLLRPGFMNSGFGPLYCSDSAPVEGVLSFFPTLRSLIDVHYIEFARPRAALVEALGEEYQGVPVLILARGRVLREDMPEAKSVRGRHFFNDEKSIRQYLSLQYTLPAPG